jgi:hypothetical protein
MPTACESRVERVVVYSRGALVTRRAQVGTVPDGEIDLMVGGLTPLLQTGSVRASLTGPAVAGSSAAPSGGRRVVSVASAIRAPAQTVKPGASVERLRTAERALERLQIERAFLLSLRARLAALELQPRLGARTFRANDDIGVRVAETLQAAGLVEETTAGLDARLTALATALRSAELERDAAALEDAQARSAERMGQGHPAGEIVVRVGGHGPVGGLTLVYAVPAARWWPVYTLRVSDGRRRAELLLEAVVAQRSGEDWDGVALALSTADLISDVRLPELPSRRFGRAQPPPRRGFRPPPEGLDRLFAAYDVAFPNGTAPGVTSRPDAPTWLPLVGGPSAEGLYNELRTPAAEPPRASKSAPTGGLGADAPRPAMPAPAPVYAAPPGAPPPPMAAPSFAGVMAGPMPPAQAAPAPRRAAAKSRASTVAAPPRSAAMSESADLAMPQMEAADAFAAPEPEPEMDVDAWLDYDGLEVSPADDRARRGKLMRAARSDTGQGEAARAIEALSAPSGAIDPRAQSGVFDHRYDADGQVELPSDGRLHRLVLSRGETATSLRYRAVPLEAPEVYAELELKSPFDKPLLGGPLEVYVDGALLSQGSLPPTGAGGAIVCGLGVEDRLKIARNVRVDEASAGLLGGTLAVRHDVSIEVASSLGVKTRVEVLERMPVTDDQQVEVEQLFTLPSPEKYNQTDRGAPLRGGLRFVLDLEAGGKSTATLRYQIKLPAKSEIVGGNRRA